MAEIRTSAIVCSLRTHGENGAIVRMMTESHGLVSGYVRGGRSRRMRPILMAGNIVDAVLRARTDDQLAGASVELLRSRAALMHDPMAALAVGWVTGATAAHLPEAAPFPPLHSALDGVIGAIEAAPAARGWAEPLARFELLLLSMLGFGMDFDQCVATGTADDLAFVSPKSGGAVSRAAAAGLEGRLFPLPPFLRGDGGAQSLTEIVQALTITGHFIASHLPDPAWTDLMAGRARMVERLKCAVADGEAAA
ncbi:MAG: hypothetical protein RLZZ58_938 [Pseudomonadota bacterium]